MKILFSIVIPSLNEEINLPILIKSIQEQTLKDFEVIIVDSGSKDRTKNKVLEFANKIPTLKFIEHKCSNVSEARNYGASLAKGNILIFFDADVSVENGFLQQVKEQIIFNNLDAMTVWNRPKEPYLQGRIIFGIMNLSLSLFQKIKPAANGPCIVMKKGFFNKVKGFDQTIVFGEDFDLIQRAHKLGLRFAVFKKPLLYVSARRFEKEGIFTSLAKSFKALLYQLIFGPIRKPIFDYEMGGQYYKKVESRK